jgi:hypothetical protein
VFSFPFVFRRLQNTPFLTVFLLLASSLNISLFICIPVFSDAIGRYITFKLLRSKTESSNRPLLSTHVYAMPTSRQPMSLDDVAYVRDWLGDELTRRLGIPVKSAYLGNVTFGKTAMVRYE